MRPGLARASAPVLFVAGWGLLALGWAMFETVPYGPSRGDRLGDVALWLLCVALATALVWRGGDGRAGPGPGSISLVGLTVALTPGVVELGGRHGDDGLALAAALALAAGLLRLWADRPRPRAWVWAATAAAAVLLAVVARPSVRLEFADAGAAARGTWDALWDAYAGWIGRDPGFGGGLPLLGVVVWSLALLALVLGAGRVARGAERGLLWVAAPVAVALGALFYAGMPEVGWFTYGAPPAPASFAPLALLPLSLLALLAGDLLARGGAAHWPAGLAAVCFGIAGTVQVLALVSLIEAAGVGGSAWIGAAVTGAATLALAGAAGAVAQPAGGPKPGGGALPQPR